MASSFRFYYDIVCPFAYMASSVVEGVAEKCGATVHWIPVLLGNCDLSPKLQARLVLVFRWFV